MIEKASDVMDKERVQILGDLLLVGKLQCAIERNPTAYQQPNDLICGEDLPDTLEMHWSYLNNMS